MHIAKAGKNSILGRRESTVCISGQKIRNRSFELLFGCFIHRVHVGEFHCLILSDCKKKLARKQDELQRGSVPFRIFNLADISEPS
jgi:hypothetical protein